MFRKEYERKLLSTVEEGAKLFKSGDVIASNLISGMPVELLRKLSDRHQELENVKVYSVFALEPFGFITDPEISKKISYTTLFCGPLERKLYGNKLFNVNSVNFSDLASVFVNQIKADWFVLQVTEMDENGFFNLGPMSGTYAREVLDTDIKVIVQVNRYLSPVNTTEVKEKGAVHLVHIDEVDYIVEHDEKIKEIPSTQPTEVEGEIAKHIVPLIKEGSTLQVGFGGLSNAVSLGLIGNVTGLAVHTEMITESMVDLVNEGVITNGVYGAFAIGTQKLYDFTATHPDVKIGKLSEINYPHNISQIDNFVSINACLMVDLTGQVASECIGTRQVSSVGGAGDFVRGATHSKGGQSFVCVTSTNKGKDGKLTSNIVMAMPPSTPVSVPRQDVMNIVTEYGIANIHNQPISERVRRLIAIAHPDFREELTRQAEEAGYLR
ncbi:MAG: acetyl-CoA hydrolase/transferase C-terminal domain-containing protein [Gemella sp.]|nr:acetyl-CoA hydrolase/transferase C-terminal domain-containing protein [Gemella sp.]